MNTENKLPVLRPEDKPAIPEPADTAAPAGEKASRWKRPETHEEKMLFWMRVTGICAILLAVLAGAAAVMLLLNLSQLGEILSHLNSASVELEEASRQLSQALQSLNNEGLQELYAALEQIQKLDMDSLNRSIESLAKIMGPLARIFG